MEHRGLHLEINSCEIRVSINDPRRGRSVLPVDPTLFLKPPSLPQFFDVRDWFGILNRPQDNPKGANQLAVVDLLDDINQLGAGVDVTSGLRQERDAWTLQEGNRAIHPANPVWPSDLDRPSWLSELDAGLKEAGFDSGWTVKIGDDHSIGVVRQRGPLRIQLTVLDGEPRVQLAVWPTTPWRPLSVIAKFFGRDESLDTDEVIKTAQQFADAAFAALEVPQWAEPQRRSASEPAASSKDPVLGPRADQDYLTVSGPMPFRSFEVEDLPEISDRMHNADTSLGGPEVQVRRNGQRPVPASLSYSGSEYFVSASLRPLLMKLVPDMTFFEFSSDGELFYVATPTASSDGDMVDYSRSRLAPFGPAVGGLVIDPLQTGRPSLPDTSGQLINDRGQWRVDREGARQLAAIASDLNFDPIWNT